MDAPHNERAGIRFNGQCDWDGPGTGCVLHLPTGSGRLRDRPGVYGAEFESRAAREVSEDPRGLAGTGPRGVLPERLLASTVSRGWRHARANRRIGLPDFQPRLSRRRRGAASAPHPESGSKPDRGIHPGSPGCQARGDRGPEPGGDRWSRTDDEESWQFELALVPGDNMVVLTTQRESGLDSQEHVEALIVYEPPCPQSPVLAPVSPLTRNRTARLQGTKSPGTLLLLNEGLIVSADVSEWSYDWPLPDADGEHVANLVAVDAKNRRSDPVTVTVTLDRRAPILTHRYPLDGETEVPTNVVVGVAFDGALEVSGIEPPVDTLIVEANGTRVPGILIYHVVSRSPELAAVDRRAVVRRSSTP